MAEYLVATMVEHSVYMTADHLGLKKAGNLVLMLVAYLALKMAAQ